MIDEYRRKRIAEDKKRDKRARFGRVYPIGREDYTREITDASNIDEEDDDKEQGTGVVCFLYKDGCVTSVCGQWCYFESINFRQDSKERPSFSAHPDACRALSSDKICFHHRRQVYPKFTRLKGTYGDCIQEGRYPKPNCCLGGRSREAVGR